MALAMNQALLILCESPWWLRFCATEIALILPPAFSDGPAGSEHLRRAYCAGRDIKMMLSISLNIRLRGYTRFNKRQKEFDRGPATKVGTTTWWALHTTPRPEK